MSLRARLLYDFQGDTTAGELDLTAEEVVTILRQDVGEGWWEGVASNGVVGLFPESYVEILDETGGEVPAPPEIHVNDVDVGGPFMAGAAPVAAEPEDDWDNEWKDDDDEEDFSAMQSKPPSSAQTLPVSPDRESSNFNLSTPTRSGSVSISRTGTLRKNINRFSTFVKSGGEAFILGATKKVQLSDKEKVMIAMDPSRGPCWQTQADSYTCTISEPTKKSKYKGIKSFTAYHIAASFTRSPVSRRFKHFDWLHDRLVEKFTMLVVPPLPDKQYSGRYGEDFVEKRREKLEIWLNRIGRHPVISRCQVMQHFLMSGDSEKEWKAGKRKAEKDPVVGSAFFLAVEPVPALAVEESDQKVENFGKFSRQMDETLSVMKDRFTSHCEKLSGPFKREFQRIGSGLASLGTCFEGDQDLHSVVLTQAIAHTGQTYSDIANMYGEQPKYDLLPFIDGIKEYLGLLSAFPDIVQVHKGAVGKATDCEKLVEEGKIDKSEVEEVKGRTNAVSAVALAEINHFQQERVNDFKQLMANFLQEQIKFYEQIIGKLNESLQTYDKI